MNSSTISRSMLRGMGGKRKTMSAVDRNGRRELSRRNFICGYSDRHFSIYIRVEISIKFRTEFRLDGGDAFDTSIGREGPTG